MQGTCINVDITWSDARLSLSVNTALFKQLTDSLQSTQTVVVITPYTIVYDDSQYYFYFTLAPRDI